MVALVTPFKDGRVDYEKLRELIDFHIANGTDGIVLAGTTGEAPTLSQGERQGIIQTAIKTVRGRLPIIAGTGTNCTKSSIQQTKLAKRLGVDGVLVVTPYYNRPSQEGLYEHFEAVARSVDIPIILYNVPSRTGVNLEPGIVARLSRLKNIVAIKDASGNLDQLTTIRLMCDIDIISGDDPLTYPLMCIGGKGVISVAANIVPAQMALLCRSALNGGLKKALEIHLRFYDLFKAMFMETNPVPVKTAMKLMGMLNGELRAPLCKMSATNQERLKSILKGHNLIR